jgi:hypothetical protein
MEDAGNDYIEGSIMAERRLEAAGVMLSILATRVILFVDSSDFIY